MAKTVGRKIRPGERRRIMCDRCNTLWDKRLLRRDSEGMWVCPQEGPGRDGRTLTEGNAEALRAFAQRLRVPGEITGQYPDPDVTALVAATGNVLGEDGTPITGESSVYILGG